jgi:hypothetical protein
MERWGGMTLADLVGTVAATMPQSRPSSLTVENYVDVVSYLLSKNDVPAGTADLPGDVDALSRILILDGNITAMTVRRCSELNEVPGPRGDPALSRSSLRRARR